MTSIHQNIFWFLTSIREHNNREFFALVKPLYVEIQDNLVDRANICMSQLHKNLWINYGDMNWKDCVFRIYRDARRIKEGQLIYKENFAMMICPNGKNDLKANWFYLHIQSGGSFLAWWLYMPDPIDLTKVRKFLSVNGPKYHKIISNPEFLATFGSVTWDKLVRVPKWFEESNKYIDIIKMKQFLVQKSYTDEEVLSEDFMDKFVNDCKIAKPFLNFLNQWCEYDW